MTVSGTDADAASSAGTTPVDELAELRAEYATALGVLTEAHPQIATKQAVQRILSSTLTELIAAEPSHGSAAIASRSIGTCSSAKERVRKS